MTLNVSLHSPTEAHAREFTSGETVHASVTFTADGQSIRLFFSGTDLWKAQALADAFNAPTVPA